MIRPKRSLHAMNRLGEGNTLRIHIDSLLWDFLEGQCRLDFVANMHTCRSFLLNPIGEMSVHVTPPPLNLEHRHSSQILFFHFIIGFTNLRFGSSQLEAKRRNGFSRETG
jgi:hypothetical protein